MKDAIDLARVALALPKDHPDYNSETLYLGVWARVHLPALLRLVESGGGDEQ